MSKSDRPDSLTRAFLKTWGPNEVPTAQITGGSVNPGTYRCMAVLGWVEKRAVWPVVALHTLVLRNVEYKPIATLTIVMPVTPKTELYVNALLQTFGWDGRVWPYDDDKGWPEGTGADEENLKKLLKQTAMSATLCFPSDTKDGAAVINIPIAKASSPFPLAPFQEVDSPPVHLERLRALCKDPSAFVRLN